MSRKNGDISGAQDFSVEEMFDFMRGMLENQTAVILAQQQQMQVQQQQTATLQEIVNYDLRIEQKRAREKKFQNSGVKRPVNDISGGAAPQLRTFTPTFARPQIPAAPSAVARPAATRRATMVCSHCKKKGHFRRDCRRLKGLCLVCGAADHAIQTCPSRRPAVPVPTVSGVKGPPLSPQHQQQQLGGQC